MKRVTSYQFAVFRFMLGGYLFFCFLGLIAREPEVLKQMFAVVLAICSICLFLGFRRQWVSVLLWIGWVSLFSRGFFRGTLGFYLVGYLLLAMLAIPRGEGWALDRKKNEWEMPGALYWGAWIFLSIAYLVRGIQKLWIPSWVEGSALKLILEEPLAHTTFIRDCLFDFPLLLKLITWLALFFEIFFGFFVIFRSTRIFIWLGILGTHFVVLSLFGASGPSLGILIFYLFLLDRNWLKPNLDLKNKNAILFFDGVCGLCSGLVDFLFREDVAEVYKVAALQGSTAKQFLSSDEIQNLNSLVVFEGGRKKTKSEAVLSVLGNVGGIWKLVSWARIFPLSFRNLVYDRIASQRYVIFGRREICRIPTESEKDRFLD